MPSVAFVITDELAAPAISGRVNLGLTVSLSGYTSFTGVKRRTVICGMDGTPAASGFLENAEHGPITWEPSQPDVWSFTLPSTDSKVKTIAAPGGGGISEPYREAVLWYGDRCLSWGPCKAPSLNGDRFDVQGAGLAWYASRRNIGFADVQNECVNGDFSDGLSSWTVNAVNVQARTFLAQDGTLFAEVADHPILSDWGNHVNGLHLHSSRGIPPDSWDTIFARQERGFTATGFERQITISADVYVQSMAKPNLFQCGIALAGYPHGYSSIFDGFTPVNLSTIDERYPVGPNAEIQRQSATITIPAADTGIVQWKLFAVGDGDVWWSNVVAEIDNGLVFNEDQGVIAFEVMDHLSANPDSPFVFATQNPNFPYSTDGYGKSNLHIDAESVDSGVKRAKKWLFSGYHNGLQALQEFAGLTDGLEFWFDYRPAAPSRRRVFRTASPYMGRARDDLPLRWGGAHGGNLTDFVWSFQGEQGSNAVTVRGQEGGIAAPAGSAIDVTDFAGGLTLEEVMQAPREAPPNTLAKRAARRLAVSSRPITLAAKLPAAEYMQRGLSVGDRLPVNIRHGEFQLVERMWLRRMTLTPDDYLELVLERWPG